MKRFISILSSALLSAGLLLSPALFAQPPAAPSPITHLGGKASAMVHFVTQLSPVQIDDRVPFITRDPDGIGQPFDVPRNSVVVVTDVLASNCVGTPGRYVAALQAAGSPNIKVPIYFDTAVDGEQKQIHLTSGVVFAETPEVSVSSISVDNFCIQAYGYLVKDR
jgi:hypothetical protein